ncbi:MAG: class I SAM-dependent methyltransferase [Enhygromyxa sp.]
MSTVTTLGNFSGQADAYARARPGYPAPIVDRLVQRAGVSPGDRVAELGAGTGLFTEALVARGLRVIAVEPSAAMRARAPALAGVEWREGSFETCPLADAEVPWVVAAQAFHWAEPERALPHLRRALRVGGRLSVLWNDRDLERSALLRFTRELIEQLVPGFDEGYRHRDWAAVLTSTSDFEAVEHDELRHVVTMSHARVLDLWRSHNKLNYACRETGIDGFLTRLAEHLRDHEPDPVELPYRCRVWTATRITS